MRVLLVSPNRLRFPYPVHPIGLDYVAGALAPAHEVRVLDLCPCGDDEVAPAVDAAVAAFRPDAVGLSIRNVDNADALAQEAYLGELRGVVARVRASTRAPIVLGGAGYTLYPDALLAALGADAGVVGEGDQARALFDALEAHAPIDGLPGVAVPGRRSAVPPPGRLPATPVRAAPELNPALGYYLRRGAILGIQTQRGCPYHCIYCTYPGIEGSRSRTFDPDAVARQALLLQAAGARYLFVTDAVFNAAPEHALAVADAFRRAGLGIPWGGYLAPTRPRDGFYARLAEAGFTHVEFGTEALSPGMLQRLGKSFRREDAEAAHRAARAAGIHTAHFLLYGGPGETAATVDETLDFCERLEGAVLFHFCGIRINAGTAIADRARAEGQIGSGDDLLAPVYYRPRDITLEQIRERVERRAAGRLSWVVGAGARRAEALVIRMHERGEAGPLWERLAEA